MTPFETVPEAYRQTAVSHLGWEKRFGLDLYGFSSLAI